VEGFVEKLPAFSALEYRHVGKDKWKLTKPFMYFFPQGTIIVPEGFVSDLDSVPRIPFMYALLKGRSVRAATVHDYLYKTQAGKAYADSLFLRAMKDEKIPKRRRYPIYWGVALFGGKAYASHAKRETS
jgi:hypothetical protein